MEMTLRRFLYLSMSFSNVGSLDLEATYWDEVVLDRTVVDIEGRLEVGLNLNFLKMWVAIDAQ